MVRDTFDVVRALVGLAARLVFWLAFLYIVGNCAAELLSGPSWPLGVASLIFAPITMFVYPFTAEAGAMFPVGDESTLIVALVVGLVSYPVSTLIGGMEPVDRW